MSLHHIQAGILRTLLFQEQAPFRELNIFHVSSDHFSFHVKKLLEQGYVEKTPTKNYALTVEGKQYAQLLDTDTFEMEKQAKLGVAISSIKIEDGVKKYLIQERKKSPYFGYYGFMTGKIKWGEKVEETAAREFLEEMGIHAYFRLLGVKHKMDYGAQQLLLEDKYFFVFMAEHLEKDPVPSFEGGANHWLTREEILQLPKVFDGVLDTIDWMEKEGSLQFIEMQVQVKEY